MSKAGMPVGGANGNRIIRPWQTRVWCCQYARGDGEPRLANVERIGAAQLDAKQPRRDSLAHGPHQIDGSMAVEAEQTVEKGIVLTS